MEVVVEARGELAEIERGLLFEDTSLGEGPEAVRHSRIRVHYVGTLEDGTEFDSSVARGDPFEFLLGVGSVIQGWEIGMLGMRKGGKRRLVIPPELGYGDREAGSIPPNSILNFEVEVLEVMLPPYAAKTTQELLAMVASAGAGLTIVDIRSPEATGETGVIEGSKVLPILDANGSAIPNLGQVLMEQIPQNTPVVLVDENGTLATELAYLMANNQWREVSYLKGGIEAWQTANQPLTEHIK
ncbi:MAG: FKBP-type peptidyl-prolyl cis-trans isomerase [Alphaproteobacteria bacterium]